jgi:hypothetical protein
MLDQYVTGNFPTLERLALNRLRNGARPRTTNVVKEESNRT